MTEVCLNGIPFAGGSHVFGLQSRFRGQPGTPPGEQYPEGADVVILPYQGNNDLPARAREVLARLKPKSVTCSLPESLLT